MGGFPTHGAQTTVVQYRRRVGATRLAQTHTAPLSAAVTPLQAAQTGRPAQLSFLRLLNDNRGLCTDLNDQVFDKTATGHAAELLIIPTIKFILTTIDTASHE